MHFLYVLSKYFQAMGFFEPITAPYLPWYIKPRNFAKQQVVYIMIQSDSRVVALPMPFHFFFVVFQNAEKSKKALWIGPSILYFELEKAAIAARARTFRGGGAPKYPYTRPQARRWELLYRCSAWIPRVD